MSRGMCPLELGCKGHKPLDLGWTWRPVAEDTWRPIAENYWLLSPAE